MIWFPIIYPVLCNNYCKVTPGQVSPNYSLTTSMVSMSSINITLTITRVSQEDFTRQHSVMVTNKIGSQEYSIEFLEMRWVGINLLR